MLQAFAALLLIAWRADNKCRLTERAEVSVPLKWDGMSSLNLTLPIVITNRNASKSPIVFLGPGNGAGNLPHTFSFASQSFPDNPVIFVGYRGVDSNPAPSDNDVISVSRLQSSEFTDSLLSKIANRTELGFTLSDFWIPQRSKDIEFVLSELGFESVHLLGIGESGSRVAHYFASSNPRSVVRMCLLNAGVPAQHNDTVVRLLAVYRTICRRDPNCPYHNIKWIPDEVPARVFTIFNVGREKLAFSAAHQLGNPAGVAQILHTLQAITDGSPMGLLALSSFSGPETMRLRWTDLVMHVCARPRDVAITSMPAMELICDKLAPISDIYPGPLENPLLIVSGELEIPRPRTVLQYFRNCSVMPTIVDQIVLNATAAKFELLRPDVLTAVLSFLNDGNTTFELSPPEPIVWKAKWPITVGLKWAMISGLVFSAIGTLFIYWKSSKGEAAPTKPARRKAD
jgi:pimeloyl-ACP methyl ester carboxylesterase